MNGLPLTNSPDCKGRNPEGLAKVQVLSNNVWPPSNEPGWKPEYKPYTTRPVNAGITGVAGPQPVPGAPSVTAVVPGPSASAGANAAPAPSPNPRAGTSPNSCGAAYKLGADVCVAGSWYRCNYLTNSQPPSKPGPNLAPAWRRRSWLTIRSLAAARRDLPHVRHPAPGAALVRFREVPRILMRIACQQADKTLLPRLALVQYSTWTRSPHGLDSCARMIVCVRLRFAIRADSHARLGLDIPLAMTDCPSDLNRAGSLTAGIKREEKATAAVFRCHPRGAIDLSDGLVRAPRIKVWRVDHHEPGPGLGRLLTAESDPDAGSASCHGRDQCSERCDVMSSRAASGWCLPRSTIDRRECDASGKGAADRSAREVLS